MLVGVLKPVNINRVLISIKRHRAWAVEASIVPRDPQRVVELVGQHASAPRQLSDQDEDALLAAVGSAGTLCGGARCGRAVPM